MQPEITQRDVAKGAGTALLARLGGVIEVVAQPAYTLMYGLATYGLYTVLWSLVNLVENIADLGMTSALQRIVPQAHDEREAVLALRHALLLGVAPCTLIALIASLGAPWLATILNVAADDQPQLVTAIALFAWALPLWAFVEIGTSAVRARRAFGPEIRLRIFWEQIIRLVIATGLWLGGVDTLGLLIAHLLSLTITAGATLRLIARHYDFRLLLRARDDGGAMRATLYSGLALLPTNVIARLFGDAPPVILNIWFPGAAGAAAAGLYGIARRLSSIVQVFRMALSYVMGPLASAVAKHDNAAIQPLYAFSTRLSTALALPVAATIAAGAGTLLEFFGEAAGAGLWFVVPLTLARAADAIGGPALSIQIVASRRTDAIKSSLIGLLAAGLTAPFAIRCLGAPGMAVAVSIGLGAWVLAALFDLWRKDGLMPFGAPFPHTLAIAGGVGLAAAAAGLGITALDGTVPLSIRAVLMLAVLLGGLWASLRFSLPEADKAAFGKLGSRLGLRQTRRAI